jgi:SAM-dependent methyltransferase/DNA-binding transcriptional ArsR family regulator
MTLSTGQAVEILRAAGEPTRLRILGLLSREELAVLELCRVLDQSQPRVSRHLKLLAEAGLVERFPDGAWVFYRLVNAGEPRHLTDEILKLIDPADPVFAATPSAWRRCAASARPRPASISPAMRRAGTRSAPSMSPRRRWRPRSWRRRGRGPFRKLVDLGSGTGRMLTLLGPHAEAAVGLDLSQQMLNIARNHVAEAGLERCELRHGDIFGTRLPGQSADLVVVHQVLHYLADPAAAVREAARLVAEGGRLIIVDFAPHTLEFLREQHQHRRLGFSEAEMARWLGEAGLSDIRATALPPARQEGLTVKIWVAERAACRKGAPHEPP